MKHRIEPRLMTLSVAKARVITLPAASEESATALLAYLREHPPALVRVDGVVAAVQIPLPPEP